MGDITWLHLSDFHFRTKKSPETTEGDLHYQRVVLDGLLKDIEGYPAKKDLKVEFVIVTGDIAYSGTKHEYDEASKFFDRVLAKLNLEKERFFVVPGNHDIDRNRISTRPLLLDNTDDANNFLGNNEEKAFEFRKFHGYRDFIKKYLKGCLAFDHKDNYFWTREIEEKRIALIGFNSVWSSCANGHADQGKLVVGQKQLLDALLQVKKAELIIAAFHHPFDWLRNDGAFDEAQVVKQNLGKHYSLVLHGHLHRAGYSSEINPDYEILTIPAGACYDKKPYRKAYNYVKFNPGTRKGKLHLRAYSHDREEWIEDITTFRKSKNGVCDIKFYSTGPSRRIRRKSVSLLIPETYKNWIDTRCEKMDIDKLVGSQDKALMRSLTLPEIFIPLESRAIGAEDVIIRADGLKAKMHQVVDIEEMAAEDDHLLIQGQAGSGKTTLMKHLAYTIIHDENRNGLNGYLPVLIFLKDLSKMRITSRNLISSTSTAEKILREYFKITGSGLSIELVKAFCKAGKALFLIDGLDEIDLDTRGILVESFAIFKSNHKGSRIILAGRPHGIDAIVTTHFGNRRADINPLHMSQVKLFIDKWHKFDKKELEAKEITPSKMFEDISKHPNIKELITTPLMLTAACILYHYDKRLPDQRAELYEKFINNLLYKRFENPPAVQDFLMKLASQVHGERKRDFSRASAIQLFASENPQRPDETARQYRLRLDFEFDRIEQNCGLLKMENGQYSFWHLTFQEFLAARDIAVHQTKHAEAIKDYWDDDWYEEVVQLLVGHLSNSSRAIAQEIVENELKKDESSPFRHWRLATKALSSIRIYTVKDRELVNKAQERLRSVFEKETDPKAMADAGETLGWLGDPRDDLQAFIPIEGGEYDLEELGKCLIKPFEIGKYPVTNQWYDEFIRAGGYENEDFWTPEGKKWLREAKKEPNRLPERTFKCPNVPVTEVCWYEADAFCRWLTETRNDGCLYRLPTEQEWQAAAAGKNKRECPWGKWRKNNCNTRETGIEKPTAVGIFLKSATPEGVADLAGNVWEWTDSWYDSDKDRKALRGGSWLLIGGFARCSARYGLTPGYWDFTVGFRCARTKK